MHQHWKRITRAVLAFSLWSLTIGAPLARATGAATQGSTIDSRAGVVAAVGCGFSAALAFRSGSPPVFTVAVFFCALMIADAISTPD
jgi:hypothetical protein